MTTKSDTKASSSPASPATSPPQGTDPTPATGTTAKAGAGSKKPASTRKTAGSAKAASKKTASTRKTAGSAKAASKKPASTRKTAGSSKAASRKTAGSAKAASRKTASTRKTAGSSKAASRKTAGSSKAASRKTAGSAKAVSGTGDTTGVGAGRPAAESLPSQPAHPTTQSPTAPAAEPTQPIEEAVSPTSHKPSRQETEPVSTGAPLQPTPGIPVHPNGEPPPIDAWWDFHLQHLSSHEARQANAMDRSAQILTVAMAGLSFGGLAALGIIHWWSSASFLAALLMGISILLGLLATGVAWLGTAPTQGGGFRVGTTERWLSEKLRNGFLSRGIVNVPDTGMGAGPDSAGTEPDSGGFREASDLPERILEALAREGCSATDMATDQPIRKLLARFLKDRLGTDLDWWLHADSQVPDDPDELRRLDARVRLATWLWLRHQVRELKASMFRAARTVTVWAFAAFCLAMVIHLLGWWLLLLLVLVVLLILGWGFFRPQPPTLPDGS